MYINLHVHVARRIEVLSSMWLAQALIVVTIVCVHVHTIYTYWYTYIQCTIGC